MDALQSTPRPSAPGRPRLLGIARRALIAAACAGAALGASGAPTVTPAAWGAGPFPLQVRMDYLKASSLVVVNGAAQPGTVVQAGRSSVVVPRTGTYTLKTTLPVSVTAVRSGQIRRFRFDLPEKAKAYLQVLTVSADMTKMWGRVSGQLTVTEHSKASIIVKHVQKGTTHTGSLARGSFVLWVPLVRGTNTLQWLLQMGPVRWPGPDIVFLVQ